MINFAAVKRYKGWRKFDSSSFSRTTTRSFYVAQTKVVRDKINFVLQMVETQRMIPKKFFRIIEGSDGIYEIKVEIESNIYRIFCCLDEGAVVVLFHGFQKKSQKTPLKEIKKAEAIKKEYFKSKEAR